MRDPWEHMAYFFVNEAGNRECEGRDEKSAAAPEYTKDDESQTILHHIPFWSALTGLVQKNPEKETIARSGEEDADDGTSIPPPRSRGEEDADHHPSTTEFARLAGLKKRHSDLEAKILGSQEGLLPEIPVAPLKETGDATKSELVMLLAHGVLTEEEEMQQRKTRETILRNFAQHLDNITAENGEKLVKATGGLGETVGRIGKTFFDVWNLNDLKDDTMQMKDRYEPGIKEAAGNAVASAGEHTKKLVVSAGNHTQKLLQHAQDLSGSASAEHVPTDASIASANASTNASDSVWLPELQPDIHSEWISWLMPMPETNESDSSNLQLTLQAWLPEPENVPANTASNGTHLADLDFHRSRSDDKLELICPSNGSSVLTFHLCNQNDYIMITL